MLDRNDEKKVNEIIDHRIGYLRKKISATPSDSFDLINKNYADTGGLPNTMTYANPISLDITLGRLHTTTTNGTVGNATINASASGNAGQVILVKITNDASANRTITFGTNFKPSATLVGTTSKSAVVSFISDGTNWFEFGRVTGL